MILVTDSAEIKLQKALYRAKDKSPQQRCLRIRNGEKNDDALATIIQCVSQEIADPDGMIFDCDDDEIFVVAAGMTSKKVDHLNDLLRQKLQSLSLPAPQEEPALMDPALHWKILMNEVGKKVENAQKRAHEERQKAEDEKKERLRKMIVDMPFEREILESLEKNRASRRKIGVMIVEDDLFTRNLISNALGTEYDITVSGDGYGGVSRYPARAPDIIFIDIDLPDINGLDVLRKILSIDKNACAVMLSGNSSRENIMKAMETGAKGFVGKPFTKEKILQYIGKCPRKNQLPVGEFA